MGGQQGRGARMRRTAMALAAVLVLTGCGDEKTTRPPAGDFAIDVVVRDADGAPVPDLAAGLAPALPESVVHVHPGWLEAGPDRDLPDPDRTYQLTVRDVAGRTIWRRSDTDRPHWPLVDDGGRPVHDGWYELETITTPLAGPAGPDTMVTPLIVYRGALAEIERILALEDEEVADMALTRATVSPSSTQTAMRCAASIRSMSPRRCPTESLTVLKRSMSIDRTAPGSPSSASSSARVRRS